MSGVDESPPDPLAVELAALLTGSDEAELREVVKRWIAEAPADATRRLYERFGERILELKRALADSPVQPTRSELEFALTLMLGLAAQAERPSRR